MKFKIGDKVKISYGIVGIVAECINNKNKNTYKILIGNNLITCDEKDLSKVN